MYLQVDLVRLNRTVPGASGVGSRDPCPSTLHDAVRFRNGLMIAFLAFIPIRLKNLAALEIGRHIVREGDRWLVTIPREETKTGAPIEFPVPEVLEPYLAFYLDVVRPRMLRRPTCTALWVGAKGGALVYGAIGQVFGQVSGDRRGLRITAHDARDAAATTLDRRRHDGGSQRLPSIESLQAPARSQSCARSSSIQVRHPTS